MCSCNKTHTLKHTEIHTTHPLVWWGFPTVHFNESRTSVPYISTPKRRRERDVLHYRHAAAALYNHSWDLLKLNICVCLCVIDYRFLLIHMGEKKMNTHIHSAVCKITLHTSVFTLPLWLFTSFLCLLSVFTVDVCGWQVRVTQNHLLNKTCSWINIHQLQS